MVVTDLTDLAGQTEPKETKEILALMGQAESKDRKEK